MPKVFSDLWEVSKDILSLHQGDIGSKITMDIDMGDHPPIVQNFIQYHVSMYMQFVTICERVNQCHWLLLLHIHLAFCDMFAPVSNSAVFVQYWTVIEYSALIPYEEASLMTTAISLDSQSEVEDSKSEYW